MTVYAILSTQEHRNMPVEEATAFIGRSFSKLIDQPAAAAAAKPAAAKSAFAAGAGMEIYEL